MMVYLQPILATLFAFVALMLMGVILLQRGRGVGLAGAFGGMGGQSAFGSKTGDVLTWATIWIAVAFLAFTVILNYVFVPQRVSVAAPPPPGQTSTESGLPADSSAIPAVPPPVTSGPGTSGLTPIAPPIAEPPTGETAPAQPPAQPEGAAGQTPPDSNPPAGDPPAEPPANPDNP